jgi:hypothetical protein
MLTESIRLSLDPDWTAQMDREFQQGLRAKVQAAHVVALLAWLAALVANQVHYEGLEQHRQQILQYLGRAKRVAFSEENMIHICGYLSILSEQKLLVDFANRSSRKWPRQPAFPYVLARYYMSLGPDQCPLPQLQTALNRALRLARADATYAEMARELESLQETMQTLMFLQQFQDHMGDSPGALPQELDDVLMSLFEAFVDEDEGLFDFDDDEPPASPRPAPRQGSRQSRSRRRKP